LTKITSTSHKTNERMSSSWVVREVAVWCTVAINMHPTQSHFYRKNLSSIYNCNI
jgi:hypothetical protein